MSFFNAEKSGTLMDNDISWRGDSALTDAFVNGSSSLAGGFYDGANGVFSHDPSPVHLLLLLLCLLLLTLTAACFPSSSVSTPVSSLLGFISRLCVILYVVCLGVAHVIGQQSVFTSAGVLSSKRISGTNAL